MGKYLISGVSGNGKTATINELARRGFTAYSTDEIPESTQLEDLKTGKFVPKDGSPMDFSKHGWNWQKSGLRKLLASDDTVFVGASVSNLYDFAHLFNKVFVLHVDEETLRHRLLTRKKDDDYGKRPDELAYILSIRQSVEDELVRRVGAIRIDATQPIEKVADEILSYVRNN